MFTGLYISILATELLNAAGDPIDGWIKFTPSSKFSIGGTQSTATPIQRRVANGAIVETLQLANPALTSPVDIGYTIQIYDANANTTETYANVAIVAADDGTWNLNTLNAGLYTRGVPHTLVVGPPGPPGATAPPSLSLTSQTGLSAFLAAALIGGVLTPADNSDVSTRAVGIATVSSLPNAEATVQTSGSLHFSGWAWDLTRAVFLGSNGRLTQTVPGAGIVQMLGTPTSPTDLLISIQTPLTLS